MSGRHWQMSGRGVWLCLWCAWSAATVGAATLESAPPDATNEAEVEPLTDDDLELFELFVDTLDEVQRNYVRPISRRELMDAAIEGVLSKLDDYSDYISPSEMPEFRREVEQQYGGIGIQLAVVDGVPTIATPLLNSPAFRAGVKTGDVITEVNGEAVEGLELEQLIERIQGEIGSDVTLTLDADQDREVTLTREIVHVETVMGLNRAVDGRWNFMMDEPAGIAYIRITAFSATTADEMQAVLEQLEDQDVRGIILDVRFNPGGLLATAVEVADLFLESGNIVRTAGRDGIAGDWRVARPNSQFEQVPIAVLVNRYSASGSEILAACLQDHQRAVVIGQRTWGKGSVQQLIPMESGRSALKLTTSSYQRPSGKNIHRFERLTPEDDWGVRPDDGMEVTLSPQATRELLMFHREAFVIPSHESEIMTLPAPDPQWAKALEVLRQRGGD